MSSPIKVVAVTAYYKPAYSFGGPVASNADLLEGLSRLGVCVTVLTTNADGHRSLDVPIGTDVEVNGVNVRYFQRVKGAPASFFYSPELREACRSCFPDADCGYFSATWTYPMLAGTRAARNYGVPYIVCPRGSFMRWSMGRKRLKKQVYLRLFERRLTNCAAAIQCTSDLERHQTGELGLRPRIVTIPNGLNLEPFASLPFRGQFRDRFRLGPSDCLSIFVGRLHPEKRVDLTIAAFARVAREHPSAHLAIAGPDDGEESRLRELTTELGMERRVIFLGALARSELLQLYSDADLLTLLSWRENFGMVVLEGMAAGLPVLLGTEVGLAQEVQAAGAGCVVGDEPDAIARAWSDLIADRDQRTRCAEQGRLLVARSFSTEAVAGRMLSLLEEIVAQPRR